MTNTVASPLASVTLEVLLSVTGSVSDAEENADQRIVMPGALCPVAFRATTVMRACDTASCGSRPRNGSIASRMASWSPTNGR